MELLQELGVALERRFRCEFESKLTISIDFEPWPQSYLKDSSRDRRHGRTARI